MEFATLCYVRHQGKTLMLYRNKKENDMHEGKWNGLGGRMEPGESPEDCVIREVYEESGLVIKDPYLKGFLTFPAFGKNEDWYVFVYTANNFDGRIMNSSPEGKLKWIPDSEIFNLNLWPSDAYFLNWVNDNRFFSAKFIYDDYGELVDHIVNFY